MNYWSPKEARNDARVAAPDWAVPHRGPSHSGVLALALATVLSFAAGVGSTFFYLQAERGEFTAAVPLIEADKTPTRVRPEGLDINGKRIATSGSITSSAMADTDLSLPIQGIPEPLEIKPPGQWQATVELAPAAPPILRSAPLAAEIGKATTSAAAPARASNFRVQLASMRTADAAGSELSRLNRLFANELASVSLAVERVDLGQRGVYYRVLSTPVEERSTAADLCATFSARRAQCMVMAMNAGSARMQTAQIAVKLPEKAVEKVPLAAPEPVPVTRPVAAAAPAPAPAVTPAQAASGVRAQLASLRSLEGATRELNRLSRLYPELEQASLSVSRVDLGDRGTFYRILTAPFRDRSAAGELCHRLGTNQAGCVLIAQRSKAA